MLPKRTSRSASLSQGQQSIRRQILALNHPIVWSGAAVLVLSGLFLAEYWQTQPTENSSNPNATDFAGRDNPLLQESPYQEFDPSANSESLPELPPTVLPGEAANPSVAPIDPALRPSVQSTQNKPPSNAITAQPAPRPGNDASVSLYNPMGIPMPRNWENLSNSAQPSDSDPAGLRTAVPDRPAANPVATPAATPTAVSPLQSALDRMRVPVNPPSSLPLSNSPQPTQAPAPVQGNPMSGNLGNGIPQGIPSTGAIAPGTMGTMGTMGTTAGQPNPTIPQPSYAPMPQTTGYTIPPSFRTPGNSSPYGSPTASPIGTPDVPSMPLNPAPMPQSNPGQAIQNNSSGAIGGREINSFSNP